MPRIPLVLPAIGWQPLCCAALYGQLIWAGLAYADTPYDDAVRQARDGHYSPALSQLRQVPGDQLSTAQISDHLQIASWAGLDAEVVQVYESRAGDRVLPILAVAATARAYRNLQRWPQAEQLYRQGLAREPQNSDLQLGLALTQADAGEVRSAVQRARERVARQPDDPAWRLALGYALDRSGAPYDALFEYDQAFIRAGDKPQVQREYIAALQRARLPEPALRLARQHPGLLEPLPLARLAGELAAERVRLAEFSSRTEAERFVIADRALADYQALLTSWSDNPLAREDLLRWRIDRMGALKARARSTQVLDEYQKLVAEGVAIPTYALRWVAAAYLDLRQPEPAALRYRQVLSAPDADPADRVDDSSALYYALLESDQPDAARTVAENLAGAERPRVELKGLALGNPSDSWMDAQQLAAQAGLHDGRLPAAEQGIDGLVNQAPGNVGLRVAQAQMYLARDWPRRAESLNKETESLAPRNMGLEVAQGYTAMDLQEWRQLDALTDDVLARFPDNRSVQRLQRLREVHEMAELRVSAYTGKRFGGGDEGAGAVSGSRDYGLETLLYSPPIDHDWRLFGGAGYAFGRFSEGDGQRRWQRLGVERRTRDMTLEAEISHQSYGAGSKLGARLAAALDIDDHWQYGASLERLAAATPLRALNSGVTANSASAFLRWRANESREWKLAVTPSRFSDGNQRLEALLSGREGLYRSAHVQVDLGLEVGASHNSKNADVPYFNPGSDFSVLPMVNVNHVLYHRYETAWSQQFQVGAGTYSQRDYSTGAMALLGYGQRLVWNDVLEAGAAVSWLSRPYDGDRERDLRLTVDLTYRF